MLSLLSPAELALCFLVVAVAGTIKGMVGFAMPMISIAGMGTFLPPELALAGLILPTLVSNGVQALRQGLGAAWDAVKKFRIFLATGAVALLATAQLFRVLPDTTLFLLLGLPVTGFTLIMLAGVRFHLEGQSPRVDAGIGFIAGGIGGLSGVWGPPTVLYLTALDTPKEQQLRVQGVIYGLGAVLLAIAHIGSGVVRAETLPFSALLVLPAMVGMWLGGKLHDRIDQITFRRVTLVILLLAALNLVRRGLAG